ncbi:hypothetical protein AAMO2058_001664600 [Amorphochlora amoebiformis]
MYGGSSESVDSLHKKLTDLALEFKSAAEKLSKKSRQNAVLKRAVVEEKKHTVELKTQIDKLSLQLEEKDRQYQEKIRSIDRLKFSNQSLKRRCEKLKDHIKSISNRHQNAQGWGLSTLFTGGIGGNANERGGGGGAGANRAIQENLKVLQEELSIKIRENEQLHMKMFETKGDFNDQIEELKCQVEKLEAELQRNQGDLDRAKKDKRELQGELEGMQALMERKEKEWNQMQKVSKITDKETQLETIEMANKIEALEASLDNHVMFDDLKNVEALGLSLPLFDRIALKAKKQTVTTCLQAARKVQLHVVSLLRHVANLLIPNSPSDQPVDELTDAHAQVVQLIPHVDDALRALSRFLEKAHTELGDIWSPSPLLESKSRSMDTPSTPTSQSTSTSTSKSKSKPKSNLNSKPTHVPSDPAELLRLLSNVGSCCLRGLSSIETALDIASEGEGKLIVPKVKAIVQDGMRSVKWTEHLFRFVAKHSPPPPTPATEALQHDGSDAVTGTGVGTVNTNSKTDPEMPLARQRLFLSVIRDCRVSFGVEWLSPTTNAYQLLMLLAVGARGVDDGDIEQLPGLKYISVIRRLMDELADRIMDKDNISNESKRSSLETIAQEIKIISEVLMGVSGAVRLFAKSRYHKSFGVPFDIDEKCHETPKTPITEQHQPPSPSPNLSPSPSPPHRFHTDPYASSRDALKWGHLTNNAYRARRFLESLNQTYATLHRNKSMHDFQQNLIQTPRYRNSRNVHRRVSSINTNESFPLRRPEDIESLHREISRLRAEVQKATAKPNPSEHPGDLPVIPGDMLETVGEINGGEAGGSAAGEGFGTEGDAKAWRTRIGKDNSVGQSKSPVLSSSEPQIQPQPLPLPLDQAQPQGQPQSQAQGQSESQSRSQPQSQPQGQGQPKETEPGDSDRDRDRREDEYPPLAPPDNTKPAGSPEDSLRSPGNSRSPTERGKNKLTVEGEEGEDEKGGDDGVSSRNTGSFVIQSQPGRIHSTSETPTDPRSRKSSLSYSNPILESPTSTIRSPRISEDPEESTKRGERKSSRGAGVWASASASGASASADAGLGSLVVVVNREAWNAIDMHKKEIARVEKERNIADKRAVELHLLLQKAATRLFGEHSARVMAEDQLEKQKQLVKKLQEDLHTSKEHYENMIKELTVHVCNLTEKLASKDALL